MFISNENYKGYYDAENVSAFLYPAKILKESYPNTITRMRMVMSKWGEKLAQSENAKMLQKAICIIVSR